MNIILWIVFGGLAGWIASWIVGSDAEMGLIANIVIGIAGAFIGGWLSNLTGLGADPGPGAERPTEIISFVWAVAGAVLLLGVVNVVF